MTHNLVEIVADIFLLHEGTSDEIARAAIVAVLKGVRGQYPKSDYGKVVRDCDWEDAIDALLAQIEGQQ